MRNLALLLFIGLALSSTAQQMESWEDNFDDNSKKWLIEDTEKRTTEVKGGEFIAERHMSGTSGWWQTCRINPYLDYEIEARMRHVEGVENYGYGLIIGRYTWDDYFTFKISADGNVIISGYKDDVKKKLKPWTELDGIKPTKQWNTLKIRNKDGVARFYVNDEEVHKEENFIFMGKQFGFILEGQMKVEFDYLKLSYVKEEINLANTDFDGYHIQNLGPKVNSKWDETSPFISADGKTLYYCRKEHPDNFTGSPDDIWYSELVNGEWTEAKNIGAPLNNGTNNSVVSVSPDGKRMMVVGKYTENKTGFMAISKKIGGEWQEPVAQEVIGYENLDRYGTRYLSADGTKLFLSLDDGETYGNTDLHICFLSEEDNMWSIPINLGPVVNSWSSDFAPFLALDNKTLYFSSRGHAGYGSADIFMTKRMDDSWMNWTEPVNLGPHLNTEDWEAYYVLSGKADHGFMCVSHGDGYGKSDVVSIATDPAYRPDPVILVSGKVYDSKTKKEIDAKVFYENLETNKNEGIAESHVEVGYKIALPKGGIYGFRGEAFGYIAESQNINTKDLEEFEEIEVDLYLTPIEKGQKITLNNTFFDSGESTLRDESISELTRVAGILIQNIEIVVEIAGHTDDVGDNSSNLKLSKERAQAVFNFLIEQGAPTDRLSFKGYGETDPIDSNKTDEGRQNNRRVELRIL